MRGQHWHERRLRRLGVPNPAPPYSLEAWLTAWGTTRGRALLIAAVSMPSEAPAGVMVTLRHTDHLFVDSELSPVLRRHTICHEWAHLILEHRGASLAAWGHYGDPEEEQEAEVVAAAMATWLARSAYPRASCGPGLPTRRITTSWARRRWLYWHLHRLWSEIHRAIPTIASDAADQVADDLLPLGGSRAYYRRIIEIHDLLRQLRPYLRDDVRQSARRRALRASVPPAEADAVGDAAAIAAALR